ncbi:hypothetical protein KOF26_00175 [Sphingomonas sp. XMGL2]|uniref:Uncharacterized protein n=1 Tax=Sphingomonas quercus TaxID=2842451 RepID=A0ABS6BD93_9SPHN|nr:hypothetical protein [Sphingomonas quercus]
MLVLVVTLFGASAALAQPSANAFNDRLRKLSPDQQKAAMRQAITNNGNRCGRVEKADFQQPYKNLMMWTATCNPGGRFAVFVGADQSVQARPCADLASLKLPVCR